MKKKCFISVPISGLDYKRQREKADIVKGWLSKKGYDVINPFEILHGKNPTLGDYIGANIKALIEHADEIFMCKGWQNSKGCRIERFVADTYGKRIMYEAIEEPQNYWR